jgi:cyclic beta-1,2-glucan synthetase
MLYLYILILILFGLLMVYSILSKNTNEDENLFDDVPKVYINKENLEKHAVEVSIYYSEVKKINCRRKLISNLDRNYEKVLKVHEYLDKDVRSKLDIIPAAEWLLDNIYLIEKEYKHIKHNMPESYYKNLPVIYKGIMKGYPRIYHIAVEIVSHTDGVILEDTIETYINAYQKNTILTSGELWALPIMLRIALIQNISRVTERIMSAQNEKKQGEAVADRIINANTANRLEDEFTKIKNENIIFTPHFVERFIKILRDNGIDDEGVYSWIDTRLELLQTTVDKMISLEHQREVNYQITIGNSISSIRTIEALNWREAFERLSKVEDILKKDPSGVYSQMDFESRDYYRHRLENLAGITGLGETFIAKKVIECALEAESVFDEAYKKHIGYYIVDKGIKKLKEKINYKSTMVGGISDIARNSPVFFYLGTIICGILLVEAFILSLSVGNSGQSPLWRYIIAAAAIVIPSSEIVISIFNWSINKLTVPRFVPKLELKDGIPEECSTIVVVPTLLNNEKRVRELIGEIEIYYLANKERNLYFALLGDFKDSKNEHEESDHGIIETALREIRTLNEKYSTGEDLFYFLCRYRKYNEKQDNWMGWERKRGKLMEFNSLLRGNNNTTYNVISSDISKLYKIKYVITLDADTQLPRDSAKKLIGAMTHVLNIPYLSDDKKRVLRGYGLMQPRVSVGIVNANKTMFSKIFSGETGIDTYTTAVSDVYQDLFGEGIFTGKGIYDIDVFEEILKDEIPENTVLSHDLLEGSYVRTALVTDIELIDGYPAYYNSSIKRLHRWVRGDWQLIKWITKKTALSPLSKWKLFDNLRRSLLTPSIIILVILSLGTLPGNEPWLILAFLSILCPIIFDVSETVVSTVKGISLTGKLSSMKMVFEQVFLIFAFIPYMSYMMVDAIVRTLYRLYISKKNLLEWQTAADAEANSGKKLKNYIGSMWMGSAIALIIGILALRQSASVGFILFLPCLIWLISPYIAYYISKDRISSSLHLDSKDERILRRIGRKTWAYFEDFVNNENNWLAPDNYQVDPANGIAYRTSPTNIAMGVTSNLCAHDLGYIGLTETTDRIDKTIRSMESLIKLKGHFYNWYDTKTKEPLYPRYVSTVDSGNLAGYLWLAAETLEEYIKEPIMRKRYFDGLRDTLILADMEIEEHLGLKNTYEPLINGFDTSKFNLVNWKNYLKELWGKTIDIEKQKGGESLYWNNKAKSNISKFLGEIQKITPWADMILDIGDKGEKITESLFAIANMTPFNRLSERIHFVMDMIDSFGNENNQYREWADQMLELLSRGEMEAEKELNKIHDLQYRINKMVEDTDFKLVYDKDRELFSIGYDVERGELNNSYYDLLASEARAASFIAIAKGDVEAKHWFKLGRAMTLMGRSKGLVSWTGTMFEYFMPLLIMKNYPDTLLNQTYFGVIEGQKNYAKARKVPWGISESAFYYFDSALNYQYKAFGVPGIGLKRGLANELVIAPYATVMTAMLDMKSAMDNIKRLIDDGMEGLYGFYEAVDYTKERLPRGKKKSIVKCFMVHHEGMSLMALNNVLNNYSLQERFHRIPRVKATELLLQERVPKMVIFDRKHQFSMADISDEKFNVIVRNYRTAKTEVPETHILSNGNYSTMISNSGSGYSKKEDMTVYRWKEDVTADNSGLFFYIKNLNSNEYWSAAYEPCKDEGDEYEVIFSLDKAEFKRRDGNLSSHMEIAVSNEDDVEVRRINITNHSDHTRIVEVTSYCEITLAPYNADIVHPVFSNLFIRTEYLDNPTCIIANRRPRAKGQKKPWVMQTVAVEGETVGTVQYETSRLNFIGRGRNLINPLSMENDAPLSNTVGAILDPVMCIRRRVRIKSGETCRIAYTTGVANSKEEVVDLARKYKEILNVSRVFDLAWTQTAVELKYLGLKSNQANLYQLMASKILFLNEQYINREKYIKGISKHQKDLWAYGISGDLPIVLVIVKNEKDVDMVRQMINAHQYWSIKGLKVDLVIINLEGAAYTQPIQDAIRDLITSSHGREKQNQRGGIFLYGKVGIGEEIMDLLIGIARLVIDPDKGSLLSQVASGNRENEQVKFTKRTDLNNKILDKEAVSYIRQKAMESSKEAETSPDLTNNEVKRHKDTYKKRRRALFSVELSKELASYYESVGDNTSVEAYKYDVKELLYFNGYGGFNNEKGTYTIVLNDHRNTPAPWINVVSNNNFGFHVSESGSAYTWSRNSRENKITPWSNDPVMDEPGEALYLKDEETGTAWSITPKPLRNNGEYVIEHGFGYSVFSHEAYGIEGNETMFTPLDESCKVCIVTLKNNTERERRLSIFYYAQLVLGVVPQQSAQYISTYINMDSKFIYGQNPYSEHFGDLKAYLSILGGKEESFTGNRKEFLGRGESIHYPLALSREKLFNVSGAGFDPCLAENIKIKIEPKSEIKFVILLGQHENLDHIEKVIKRYSDLATVENSLQKVKDYWKELLGRIQVKTPDESMDLMLNGWLMYQTIACRYWSRTAFYQSGGAYGYRDQLQDSMAIGFLEPTFTKEQIIRSAERQFTEGDVQHWWHPVIDSGIRTRFSDDLLWLPYVTIDYIKNTGDYSILKEETGFLKDEPLREGEDERYKISGFSEEKASIYEHCVRAIERGLRFGPHNIPLMGSGDWNDGMSEVGNKGRGESVWLGWFLYDILEDFKELCRYMEDDEKYTRYEEMTNYIRENLEDNAWDGSWYRRAYFDDGTPLGSAQNDECQIDSLAQSWGVISGAASKSRALTAMDALEKHLIREDKGIILLLTPAFDNSKLEPGYIKGYVPGVRENGAQYTHAAVWVVMAMAKLGRGDKAWKLFNMINPINHSNARLQCENYKVEPYVMAADVYIREPYAGRGGWSWYTGAAGWMFRVGIQSILGLQLKGEEGFTIEPNIPQWWNSYEIKYRRKNSVFNIRIIRGADKKILLNGKIQQGTIIPYLDGEHEVEVII